MFQSVFVITDRRVLNKQLQDTILGFEHKAGQVVTITDADNSSVLRDAINDKARIIITTLHRFPLIYQELNNHAGKKFAIIVDEAHSSQSGKSAEKLKSALADTDETLKEWAEIEGRAEDELIDEMESMSDLLSQGQHKNQYFYAFTATPKPKTLRIFGEWDGEKYNAFHHYSMRQAISEGFILDVLQYYTTIETAYRIIKTVSEDPELEEPPATKAVKAYHDNHEFVLEQKVGLIVEKIKDVTLNKMNGEAKAMVVCASRAHAVRYYLAMKEYCKQKGYDDVNPLVAFSGSVSYMGNALTEGIDYVVNKAGYDFGERSTNNNTDCHIDYITFCCKFLEILKKLFHILLPPHLV
jgi:type I restriction enzyme R subunit